MLALDDKGKVVTLADAQITLRCVTDKETSKDCTSQLTVKSARESKPPITATLAEGVLGIDLGLLSDDDKSDVEPSLAVEIKAVGSGSGDLIAITSSASGGVWERGEHTEEEWYLVRLSAAGQPATLAKVFGFTPSDDTPRTTPKRAALAHLRPPRTRRSSATSSTTACPTSRSPA